MANIGREERSKPNSANRRQAQENCRYAVARCLFGVDAPKLVGMPKILNIRCGSDIRDALNTAGIPGDFAEYGDPICEGPTPSGLGEREYLELRAGFMHRHWQLDLQETIDRLGQDARCLQDLADYDELLLWFEHDLYDQCILIQLLAALPDEVREKSRMICIGAYPGVERFVGLGQLRPEQLATLPATARAITAAECSLAQKTWTAWRAPTPDALQALALQEAPLALKYLASAITRHLQEFPSVEDGLGQTEFLIVQAMKGGASTAIEVFQEVHRSLEAQPFLGDLMFWAHFAELSRGVRPALRMQGDFPIENLELTEHGHKLLQGQSHHLRANGIDADSLYRWRGGVEQRAEEGWVYGWSRERSRVEKIAL